LASVGRSMTHSAVGSVELFATVTVFRKMCFQGLSLMTNVQVPLLFCWTDVLIASPGLTLPTHVWTLG
jgi:hypothetical protein